ncbi:MAG: SGNH/GDSL hydrolase family protein [Lachnospiraceae bacterium]|nr:SGNH/GDSL hydrolase family protein [Lachnospiraceae bacterium]
MRKKKAGILIATLLCLAFIIQGCAGAVSSDTGAVPVQEATEIKETDDIKAEEQTAQDAETEDDVTKIAPDTGKKAADNSDKTVVWLGDSLTQGSLGDMDDNLPNAPYEKLKQLSGAKVEGFGFYGFNTHDILWSYTAEAHAGQKKDPNKIYVFWCGSNDWTPGGIPNTDTAGVISEIDSFVAGGGITKYIVLGTTARNELRPDGNGPSRCELINKDLKAHYKERYLELDSFISIENGYVADKVHLTQASYDTVAYLVYEKLKQMGYLN